MTRPSRDAVDRALIAVEIATEREDRENTAEAMSSLLRLCHTSERRLKSMRRIAWCLGCLYVLTLAVLAYKVWGK